MPAASSRRPSTLPERRLEAAGTMKLFGLNITRAAAPEQKSFSSAVMAFLRGEDGSEAGGATLTNAFTQSTWVYACVTAIARQVANTPFCITQGRGQGEVTVESGPAYALFNRPHPQFTRFEFWELIVCWLLLRGELFLVPLDAQGAVVNLSRPRSAPVAQFALLDPAGFHHIVADGQLIGWRYTAPGHEAMMPTMDFLPEEVIHHRLPNPFNLWRGLSPLAVANLPAQADYAAAQFHKGLMLNNADTGVIVTTDNVLDDQQREQIMAALKERKRKAGTADRPLFLTGGAKIEKPTLSSADMQFLDNRKYSRQEICAIYGVSPEILGLNEDANRAVSVSARFNFIENTCSPHAERLEAALARVLDGFGPDLWAYFDFDSLPIMQAARLERVATGTALFNMGVPFNDINEVLDLGFPSHPWGDKAYLPFTLQQVGIAPAPPAQPDGTPAAQPVSAAASLRAALEVLERGRPRPQPAATADVGVRAPAADVGVRAPHQCAGAAEYAASISGSVKAKVGKLGKFFLGQRARVLAALDNVGKDCGTPSRWLPLSTLNSPTLNKSLEDIFNTRAENDLLKAALKPLLIADLQFGGTQLWHEFSLGDFLLPPKAATDYLLKAGTRWEEINGLTHTNLRETLADGLTAGESFEQLADRVRSVFNDASGPRSDTIALTETNTAINSGRHEGLLASPIENHAWLSANLANSRPEHQEAGERYADGIPKDQPFVLKNGATLLFPGDTSLGAGPGDTINCKCHVIGIASGGKAVTTPTLSWEAFLARRSPQERLGASEPASGPSEGGKAIANSRSKHPGGPLNSQLPNSQHP